MNRACADTRRYLDSYVSSELLVETNHDVLRHLETCPACTAEAQTLTLLRARVKSAVKSQSAPPDLQVRIRERIRARESAPWLAAGWFSAQGPHWAATAAATLLIAAGAWWGVSRDPLPALTDRPAQTVYFQRISSSLSAILKVGLGDHVHCAIFRKYPGNPPTPEEMAQKLGPSYQGLLPIVKTGVPEGYRVIMAHQCTYSGRKFVHLTMEKNGDLLSLVIARKEPGESLDALSQSAAGRYQVAAFDAGDYLAYIVSDLSPASNLEIANTLAPSVRQFLLKVAA